MNSYLRLYYYNNKVNLIALGENLKKYNLNININKDFIKPKNKRIKYRAFFGFISSLSFFMIVTLLGGIKLQKLYHI